MPAFNIPCNTNYLVVDFGGWFKTDCLIEAQKHLEENGGILYERYLSDWFEADCQI